MRLPFVLLTLVLLCSLKHLFHLQFLEHFLLFAFVLHLGLSRVGTSSSEELRRLEYF
jgi:hypothetical protein